MFGLLHVCVCVCEFIIYVHNYVEIIRIIYMKEVEFFNCSSYCISFQTYLVFYVPCCHCILYSISYIQLFYTQFFMLFCGKTLHIRDKIIFVLGLYYEALSWRIYWRTAKYRECYVTKYGTFILNFFCI